MWWKITCLGHIWLILYRIYVQILWSPGTYPPYAVLRFLTPPAHLLVTRSFDPFGVKCLKVAEGKQPHWFPRGCVTPHLPSVPWGREAVQLLHPRRFTFSLSRVTVSYFSSPVASSVSPCRSCLCFLFYWEKRSRTRMSSSSWHCLCPLCASIPTPCLRDRRATPVLATNSGTPSTLVSSEALPSYKDCSPLSSALLHPIIPVSP